MREWIAFICVQVVSLYPLILYFVSKKVVTEDDYMKVYLERVKAYALRGIITLAIMVPVFIVFVEKRMAIVVLDAILQVINGILFRQKK